jgi:predicted nucleic acid-binding protein
MMWVIDASVAVKWLLEDENHPNAEAVLNRMLDLPQLFAVPELFGYEVFAVLTRIHPDGMDAFTSSIIPILQSGIFRQPMTKDLARTADIFIQSGLTGYDACYAALAKDLNGTWLTYDKKAHTTIQKFKVSHDLTKTLPQEW